MLTMKNFVFFQLASFSPVTATLNHADTKQLLLQLVTSAPDLAPFINEDVGV